jgi:RNA polymerase sigma-70 factor, ECF subfamily
MDDLELLSAIADDDLGALRTLHERHAPWLRARLARRCADADLVDEALADTFVAVWRGAGRFRGDGEVGAWMWGIAIRRLIDLLRRRRAPTWLPARLEPSAEDELLAGIAYGDVGAALERLSPELLVVVQATVLDGLTMREAGQLLGIPTGTVKTRLRRARLILREALS